MINVNNRKVAARSPLNITPQLRNTAGGICTVKKSLKNGCLIQVLKRTGTRALRMTYARRSSENESYIDAFVSCCVLACM